MMLTPVRTSAPATNPVTLVEAKAHLREDSSDNDTLIGALIDAATAHLDGWSGILGRCMVTQTWRQDYDSFWSCGLPLPFPDVQSVTVAYTDENEATQTLAAANYHLLNEHGGSRLIISDTGTWPSTFTMPTAARVTMVCGYGAAASVPAALKAAILLHVGHLYSNREAAAVGVSVAELPFAYDAWTAPYRRVGL